MPALRTTRNRLLAAAGAAAVGATLIAAPTAAFALLPVVNDAYIAHAGERFEPPVGQGVLANDPGADQASPIKVVRAPSSGMIASTGLTGTFSYQPVAGFIGIDSFDYCSTKVPDGPCVSDTATATISVTGVERLGGANRYVVSAAVSARTFPPGTTATPGVPVAYIASGEQFPDALSASARAGAEGGPVLLTAKDSLPQPIIAELVRLKPAKIVVVGGRNAVSQAVFDSLAPYSTTVERLAGADRYEGSALISSTFASPRPVVYLASGAGFPDALSGSAAAGLLGGPVLLTTKESIPATVMTELNRLQPGRIVVLGGTAAVAESVVQQLETIRVGGKPVLVNRVRGADRFEVSGQTSTEFPQNTETVYITNGTVFPDALSGSAAAIRNHAPVLLITADSIPAEIDSQLKRLNPVRIVVLGGESAVRAGVLEQLKGYLKH